MGDLPETGFVRLFQILGDKSASPPVPPIIPVSKSTWWAGINSGLFPKPKKIGDNISIWSVEDIKELIVRLNAVSDSYCTQDELKTAFDSNIFTIVKANESGRNHTISFSPDQAIKVRNSIDQAFKEWGS